LTSPLKNVRLNTTDPQERSKQVYKMVISKGRKQMLSFVDRNAVAAHSLVSNANKTIKKNSPKYSYTYAYIKP